MLLDAGEDQWGTEESVLNEILITKSYQQLRRIFQHYEEIAGHTLDEEIKREFLDPLEEEYVALGKEFHFLRTYVANPASVILSYYTLSMNSFKLNKQFVGINFEPKLYQFRSNLKIT